MVSRLRSLSRTQFQSNYDYNVCVLTKLMIHINKLNWQYITLYSMSMMMTENF